MRNRILCTTIMFAMVSSCLVGASPAAAQELPGPRVVEAADGSIIAGTEVFDSWRSYLASEYFKRNGMRCGAAASGVLARLGGSASDCTYNSTNPAGVYDPSVVKYRIPVVVHVIRRNNGSTGHISASMVQSQIDILNEDFLAILGSNGQNGTDVQIEFYLATQDPGGSPTSGITYSDNDSWYNDGGSYWNSLAWDTNRYLNIYTNTAGGYLGYVPDLPQGGIAGSNSDRVVVYWASFGRNAPIGPPFDQGRTTTHEVGHYLGLWHTFDNGCGSASACYTSGDRICDTNPESGPNYGCSGASSCGSSDPIDNYMDYTDDLCMTKFTPEQARRIRCSLEHYRPNLYETVGVATCDDGIQNQGEDRIDCGGPCPPCACLSDGACDDSLFCTGTETCDAFGQCQSTGYPCQASEWCDESAGCVAYGDGDFDFDNDVDLLDFNAFQGCFGQLGLGVCGPGKMAGSGPIDLDDYAAFAAALGASGPQ